MLLRNIAKINKKEANLKLKKERIIIAPNKEFEIEDERAKELLDFKNEDGAIVEIVKEQKKQNTSKED